MKLKPTRIIFKYNGKYYKFMSYFVDKTDNSFYFHIYNENIDGVKQFNISKQGTTGMKIDFENVKGTDFKRNKLSFHQSGYIHSTDNNSKRLEDGIIGTKFKNIETSLSILVLGPQRIDTLTEIKATSHKTDIVFDFKSNIQPFTVHFDIYRLSNESKLDISNPNLYSGEYIMTRYDHKEFGLRMYLQKLLGDEIWPPFNLVLKRIK